MNPTAKPAVAAAQIRTCVRCVMDTTDPRITFDAHGMCSHCTEFDAVTRKGWHPDEKGRAMWKRIVDEMRAAGKGRDYDCVLGLSGGVDSSYLAMKANEWGIRPLVVHVDAGWNSELAVANIEKIVKHCKFDLHTHVVDWEEMRDLQIAYLRAGLANQDVPQDHAFFANMYHFATKAGIRYVLSGGNIATEGIFPHAWQGPAMDAINLKAIHRRHGERPLRSYRTVSFFDYYINYPFIRRMRVVRPLNYMPYDKAAAIDELQRVVGWRSYGRKHGESLFTKLFQNYYQPAKFGYDKRKPHLSSLIVSGQMTREQALQELAKPLYDPDELELDIAYFCKKLRISRAQFDAFITNPPGYYEDYPNWLGRYRALKSLQKIVNRVRGRQTNVYS
jgi:aminotransferase